MSDSKDAVPLLTLVPTAQADPRFEKLARAGSQLLWTKSPLDCASEGQGRLSAPYAAAWPKSPSWWCHSWPPSAHQAASEGLELPFVLVRKRPAPQIPENCRGEAQPSTSTRAGQPGLVLTRFIRARCRHNRCRRFVAHRHSRFLLDAYFCGDFPTSRACIPPRTPLWRVVLQALLPPPHPPPTPSTRPHPTSQVLDLTRLDLTPHPAVALGDSAPHELGA